MAYLLSHWRGKFSLNVSLWINFIGLLVVISLLELYTLSKIANPAHLVKFSIGTLLLTRLIIYPWQLVGLFRATEFDFIEHRQPLKTRSIQLLILLSIAFTLIYSLQVIQGALAYRQQLHTKLQTNSDIGYSLNLSDDQQRLLISGVLDNGITKASRQLLEAQPQINAVQLNSRGGQIYQGRGLAKLFMKFKLDTYVEQECSSACVTAYIGGQQRFLAENGKLGFHQYKVVSKTIQPFISFYQIDAEQKRDRIYFKSRGIRQSFLDKMFEQPASNIWFPDLTVLLDSQVVHSVFPSRE